MKVNAEDAPQVVALKNRLAAEIREQIQACVLDREGMSDLDFVLFVNRITLEASKEIVYMQIKANHAARGV